MAGVNPHRTPSAGAVIKKMHEINPELGVHELGALLRRAMRARADADCDFAGVETIDEELALRLARETLGPGAPRIVS